MRLSFADFDICVKNWWVTSYNRFINIIHPKETLADEGWTKAKVHHIRVYHIMLGILHLIMHTELYKYQTDIWYRGHRVSLLEIDAYWQCANMVPLWVPDCFCELWKSNIEDVPSHPCKIIFFSVYNLESEMLHCLKFTILQYSNAE